MRKYQKPPKGFRLVRVGEKIPENFLISFVYKEKWDEWVNSSSPMVASAANLIGTRRNPVWREIAFAIKK